MKKKKKIVSFKLCLIKGKYMIKKIKKKSRKKEKTKENIK